MQTNRGYYVLVARQNDTYPPEFRWQIMRRGEPITLLAGVTSVLRDVDYAYSTNLNWPKKARRDSKYGILFRGCFAHIIDVISDIENAYQPALRVTIETGHKNAPDTEPDLRMGADPTGTKPGIIWASFCRQEKLPSNRGGGPSCLQRVGSGSWTKANRNTQDAQQIRCVLPNQYCSG